MKRGSLILAADLVIDVLAIAILVYLFASGYFADLERGDLDKLFLRIGLIGLVLLSLTIYLVLKEKE